MDGPGAAFAARVPFRCSRGSAGPATVCTFAPDGAPAGAVLLLHHRTGLDAFTAHAASRLLAEGFIVAVPDLFAAQPAGLAPEERKRLLRDDDVLDTVAACARAMPPTPAGVAALGFCMGGRFALLAAVAGAGVGRACCFYGGEIDRGWHTRDSPLARVGPGVAPVQAHRGARDSNATAAQLDAAIAAFDRVGGYFEALTYAGARHAFANPFAAERHHPTAAARAWGSATAFLRAADLAGPHRTAAELGGTHG